MRPFNLKSALFVSAGSSNLSTGPTLQGGGGPWEKECAVAGFPPAESLPEPPHVLALKSAESRIPSCSQ